MPINQLFKSVPPKDLVEELITMYGLSGFDDTKPFSKNDLIQLNTLKNINNIIVKIDSYYLPCKKKIYLKDIDYKKLITILRQCIRLYNYKLLSKEKYLNGEKIIEYHMCLNNINNNLKNDNVGTIVFD